MTEIEERIERELREAMRQHNRQQAYAALVKAQTAVSQAASFLEDEPILRSHVERHEVALRRIQAIVAEGTK